MGKKIYHEGTYYPTCPSCGWQDEGLCHINSPSEGERKCGECGKKFTYEREEVPSYSTSKIDDEEEE